MTELRIEAPGLDRLGQAELLQYIEENFPSMPSDALSFRRAPASERLGEPATIVAIVSLVALRAFVAWVAHRPRNNRITQEIRIALPDGTIISKSIDVKQIEPVRAQAEVVREILNIEGLPEEAKKAIGEGLQA